MSMLPNGPNSTILWQLGVGRREGYNTDHPTESGRSKILSCEIEDLQPNRVKSTLSPHITTFDRQKDLLRLELTMDRGGTLSCSVWGGAVLGSQNAAPNQCHRQVHLFFLTRPPVLPATLIKSGLSKDLTLRGRIFYMKSLRG